MTDFAKFKRHVGEVQRAANVIIEKRKAKARWPTLREEDRGEAGKFFAFEKPAILWDAPLRKTGLDSRNKRAIVLDGHFYFKEAVFYGSGVHLEVYATERQADGHVQMKLLDTMHFDFEPHSNQTAFHPIFHVQFARSKRLKSEEIIPIVCELGNVSLEKLSLIRELDTPMRDVRIPTPQMDYMSVLAMVVADYFCDTNWSREVNRGFVQLLRQVMHASNPARSSSQSQNLEGRWMPQSDIPFCASHWYAESHA